LSRTNSLGLIAAACLAGAGGCAGLPEGQSPHPEAGQPADAFSMAQRRCTPQGKEAAISLRDPIRGVRIGGQQVYRAKGIICE
jgi:hypothetical protein